MIGKAFRAELGRLTSEEESSLRSWGEENCASSVVFREAGNVVVWLCARERPFTKVNFMRSTRSLLKRLGVGTHRLKMSRSWLILIAPFTVHVEAEAARGMCLDIDPPGKEVQMDTERSVALPNRRPRAGKEDLDATAILRDER